MNGVVYPEITAISKASSGGYLSDAAASQLSTFKTSASKDRYKVQGFTVAVTSTSASVDVTAPSGYSAVASVGVKYANNGGNLRIYLSGERYTSKKAYVYYLSGTTGNISGNATIYVLFRRVS